MTLPDDMGYPDGEMHESGIGLGIGVSPSIGRIPRSSPKISEYSSPSDSDGDVPRSHPGLGTSSSFRQKRLQASAMPGPSRYPGMLQIPDSTFLPRTVSKRRIASTGSTPDSMVQHGSPLVYQSSSLAQAPVPSPSHTPPLAATSRLQAIVGDSVTAGRDRRRSQSVVSSMSDRSGRRRRRSPDNGIVKDGVQIQQRPRSPGSYAVRADSAGTTTPLSTRPPSRSQSQSRSRRSSIASARLPFPPLKPLARPDDSQSSTSRVGAEETVDPARVDVAKTLSRKRKQSEDHASGARRRSLSTVPADGLLETTAGKNGKSIHVPEGKNRPRAPLDDMGLEGALRAPRAGASQSSETSGSSLRAETTDWSSDEKLALPS